MKKICGRDYASLLDQNACMTGNVWCLPALLQDAIVHDMFLVHPHAYFVSRIPTCRHRKFFPRCLRTRRAPQRQPQARTCFKVLIMVSVLLYESYTFGLRPQYPRSDVRFRPEPRNVSPGPQAGLFDWWVMSERLGPNVTLNV